LNVTAISSTGSNASYFTHTSNCGGNPLAQGASCTVQVTFKPTAAVSLGATLTIADNEISSPKTVALTGTGTTAAPAAKLSATSLSFPSTQVGSTSTLPLTITNSGGGTLSVSAISSTGANASLFTHTSNCGGNPLAAGASCTAQVIFSPTAAGSFTATLNITDNATGSPQTVTLTATGH
jgi:acetylornithine/succinyldiaminopimelate/putrescine aminotransferase